MWRKLVLRVAPSLVVSASGATRELVHRASMPSSPFYDRVLLYMQELHGARVVERLTLLCA